MQIALCRDKLYLLEGKDLAVDESPEGTTEWRISCASTLMMTVRSRLYTKPIVHSLCDIIMSYQCSASNCEKI